jgi:hypothetical protein
MVDTRYRKYAGAVFTLKYHLVFCPILNFLVGRKTGKVAENADESSFGEGQGGKLQIGKAGSSPGFFFTS